MTTIVHGTAVAFQNDAVLLRGKSGSGKSDLAFRLIGQGAVLVADDQVVLEEQNGKLLASPAEAIKGLLEIRGIGLVKYPVSSRIPLRLIIDLVPREDVERLPEWKTVDISGIAVPTLKLHAFDTSTPFKIIKAIELVQKPSLLVG